jgi:hypothetical protein
MAVVDVPALRADGDAFDGLAQFIFDFAVEDGFGIESDGE